MGTQAADAIKPIIENNATPSTGYLATLISTVVFSATGVFIELQNSMNSIWGVKLKAHHTNQAVLTFIRARLLSLAMVFGLGFLLVLFIFISGILTAFHQGIAHLDHWPAYLVGIAMSFSVEFTLFGVLFKFLPDVRLGWKDVWHGGFKAAHGCVIDSRLSG
jgi:membrane protein